MPELRLPLRPLESPGTTAARARHPSEQAGPPTLTRWSATVAAAHDACLVVDRFGRLLSMSASAADLLGCGDEAVIGRPLLSLLDLVDFEYGDQAGDYGHRIAPVLALATAGIARSLLRLRREGQRPATLDVVGAAVRDEDGRVVGAVSFLAPITHG